MVIVRGSVHGPTKRTSGTLCQIWHSVPRERPLCVLRLNVRAFHTQSTALTGETRALARRTPPARPTARPHLSGPPNASVPPTARSAQSALRCRAGVELDRRACFDLHSQLRKDLCGRSRHAATKKVMMMNVEVDGGTQNSMRMHSTRRTQRYYQTSRGWSICHLVTGVAAHFLRVTVDRQHPLSPRHHQRFPTHHLRQVQYLRRAL